MKVIDHGAWTTYVPTSPYPAAPVNALHCRRDSDSVDWWAYLYGSDPERLDPQAIFGRDTVKMTVDRGAVVQQVTRDATMIFPQSCRALEVVGDDVADPFAKYNGKVWNGREFVDAPPSIPDVSRRQFFQQAAIAGLITGDEALAALGAGVVPQLLLTIVAGLPADQQFGARMLLAGATTFQRTHALTEFIAAQPAINWTADQTDAFFIAAGKLG